MGKRKRQAEAEAAACSQLLCKEGLDDADVEVSIRSCTPESASIPADHVPHLSPAGPCVPRCPSTLSASQLLLTWNRPPLHAASHSNSALTARAVWQFRMLNTLMRCRR